MIGYGGWVLRHHWYHSHWLYSRGDQVQGCIGGWGIEGEGCTTQLEATVGPVWGAGGGSPVTTGYTVGKGGSGVWCTRGICVMWLTTCAVSV